MRSEAGTGMHPAAASGPAGAHLQENVEHSQHRKLVHSLRKPFKVHDADSLCTTDLPLSRGLGGLVRIGVMRASYALSRTVPQQHWQQNLKQHQCKHRLVFKTNAPAAWEPAQLAQRCCSSTINDTGDTWIAQRRTGVHTVTQEHHPRTCPLTNTASGCIMCLVPRQGDDAEWTLEGGWQPGLAGMWTWESGMQTATAAAAAAHLCSHQQARWQGPAM